MYVVLGPTLQTHSFAFDVAMCVTLAATAGAAIMMAARVGDSVNDSSLLATFKTPASGEGTEIDSEVRGGAG